MRLLLVEDDLAIQRFVAQALVEAGYRVDTASDAKRAEALAVEGPTGQSVQTQSDVTGAYQVPNLPAGDYEISVSGVGFDTKVANVLIAAGAKQTFDATLTIPSGAGPAPTLADLGISPTQATGDSRTRRCLAGDYRYHPGERVRLQD